MSDTVEAKRPWVTKHIEPLGVHNEAVFMDRVAAIAVKEGTDVGIRDVTRADYTGKSYWGPDVSVLSLVEAKKRVSPDALNFRIAIERAKITEAEATIKRLEAIRAELYGGATVDPSISS